MPSDETWSECPNGEITKLQQLLKERRIQGRRKLMFAAGSATLGIASAGIGIILFHAEPSVTILSCQECVDLLPRYVEGTLSTPSKQKAVEKHLVHCEKCRKYLEATY
ncbi:hypothetical protein C5Y96_16385 [Blastopirellula marina]|uniref:Putative zinc-finger domain-containing protein n=1 Tax=Blastopirellula marina TaxID=124 RepID=A0A2S8F725_9BACT|nr:MULTISPECIES: zf-HC2 domain-containing protein [Pirellulaceae]PQO27956.1 hypothetical protein C5Y96_16385 [Blastopirellula marina]RCS48381.1 zf-HC2 domain-containing protein [Bremerella cremea]